MRTYFWVWNFLDMWILVMEKKILFGHVILVMGIFFWTRHFGHGNFWTCDFGHGEIFLDMWFWSWELIR